MNDQKPMFSVWTSKNSQRNAIETPAVEKPVTEEQAAAIRCAFLTTVDDARLSSYKTVHNENALARLFG
jgi:type VI protein secretion system component VasF